MYLNELQYQKFEKLPKITNNENELFQYYTNPSSGSDPPTTTISTVADSVDPLNPPEITFILEPTICGDKI